MARKKLPFELTLIVTHGCNLNCVYCYEHHKKAKVTMPIDTAKNAIKKYMSEGEYESINICFIGGEPLLEFHLIKEICEWVWANKWNKSYIFEATTNGTLLNDEMKQWFKSHNKQFILSLSLDGTKETHNINRCNSFDKIDLSFFKDNWPLQPVKMTISDLRLDHLAEDVEYIHKLGFLLNGCNFAEGVEMTDFDNKLSIIKEQYNRLVDFYLDHPEYESRLFNIPFAECEYRSNVDRKRCGTGENMAVIDIDGKVYPCTYFSSVSMDKKQLDAALSIDFKDINNFIDNKCINDCYIYPICHGCYGDNYSTTGNLATRSKQKCELNKLKVAAASRYMAIKMQRKLEYAHDISQTDAKIIVALKKITNMFN